MRRREKKTPAFGRYAATKKNARIGMRAFAAGDGVGSSLNDFAQSLRMFPAET